MKRAVVLCLLVACGKVDTENEIADAQPDPGAPDATVDAVTDASADAFVGCFTDEFNGTALDPVWDSDAVGAAPAVMLGTGKLTISDAALAMSSHPGDSWVYDLESDKGNQMVWRAPVGTRDFTLTTTFDWQSAASELTYASIAVVGSDGLIHAQIGFQDGSAGEVNPGLPFGTIRVPGDAADQIWDGPRGLTGTNQQLTLRRTGGTLLIRSGGDDAPIVLERDAADVDIQGLAIVSVRHRSARNVDYVFGSVSFDRVSLCVR